MRLESKVEAIGAIRDTRKRVDIVRNEETRRYELHFNTELRDDKELVEAIMAFGVRSYLNDMNTKAHELLKVIGQLQAGR